MNKRARLVPCPYDVCTNHFHAGSCIICNEACMNQDCAYFTAWLCRHHFNQCDLLDPSNPVTEAWDRFCAKDKEQEE